MKQTARLLVESIADWPQSGGFELTLIASAGLITAATRIVEQMHQRVYGQVTRLRQQPLEPGAEEEDLVEEARDIIRRWARATETVALPIHCLDMAEPCLCHRQT